MSLSSSNLIVLLFSDAKLVWQVLLDHQDLATNIEEDQVNSPVLNHGFLITVGMIRLNR